MTQAEIIEVLKKKNKWMTVKEVAKELNLGRGSTNKGLGKLENQALIFKRGSGKKKTLRLKPPYKYKIK